jgi:N-acyl-D-amino-acid deacylase
LDGWFAPTQGDATWEHGGALPGTTSRLVRSYHNFSWVALFNARSWTANFDAELDAALWTALAQSTSFRRTTCSRPSGDVSRRGA